MRMLRPVVLIVMLGATACTPPSAGRSCAPNEPPLCADANNSLVCTNSFWETKPCAGGCKTEGGRITCQAPTPGVACTSAGFLCYDATTAMECRVGVWLALPCRGPSGCANSSGVIRCDMSANLEGDACASTAEGRGLCTTDGRGTLECRSGTLLKTNTCRTCTVSGDQVVCQP